MTFIRFTAVASLSLLLFSCGEDNDQPIVRSNTDYAPNTVGSTWTYKRTYKNIEGSITETKTILNAVKELNGKSYYVVRYTDSVTPFFTTESYFRRKGSNLIYIDTNSRPNENREQVVFKQGPVGTTWATSGFIDLGNMSPELPVTIKDEIIELNGTYTFDNQEFTNVMVIKTITIIGEENEGEEDYYTLNYYVKGIGQIRKVDSEGITRMELLSYTIQ